MRPVRTHPTGCDLALVVSATHSVGQRQAQILIEGVALLSAQKFHFSFFQRSFRETLTTLNNKTVASKEYNYYNKVNI